MKRRSVVLYGNGSEYTDENIKLNETQEEVSTKKLAKRFGYSALHLFFYVTMNLLFVLAIIGIVVTLMDLHPHYKRASRMVDVDVDKANGTLSSSTCKYYAGLLSREDRAKWEQSALAETNQKCDDAKIIMSQWKIWMKVRMVLYDYVPWASGEFLPFLRDSFMYILGVVVSLSPFIAKFLKWASPIATAHQTLTAEDP